MTVSFVVIGLVCNSLGCYWTELANSPKFADQQPCYAYAAEVKSKSAMFFDTACMAVTQR
jgi:hypothetical protein